MDGLPPFVSAPGRVSGAGAFSFADCLAACRSRLDEAPSPVIFQRSSGDRGLVGSGADVDDRGAPAVVLAVVCPMHDCAVSDVTDEGDDQEDRQPGHS